LRRKIEQELPFLYSPQEGSLEKKTRGAVDQFAMTWVNSTEQGWVNFRERYRLDDLRLADADIAQVNLLGKGKKPRSCPLWPETVTALGAYLHQRRANQIEIQQVFLNANGEPITRFGIRHITRKYGLKAQMKHPSIKGKTVNPHTLRHTTAMHLLRSGNDIYMVSYWLGHASINTTHIYVEIDMDMKRKMLEKAEAPRTKKKVPWQKPDILQWLDKLTRESELCAVNYCQTHGMTGGTIMKTLNST
jgi:hypothetical protein